MKAAWRVGSGLGCSRGLQNCSWFKTSLESDSFIQRAVNPRLRGCREMCFSSAYKPSGRAAALATKQYGPHPCKHVLRSESGARGEQARRGSPLGKASAWSRKQN